MTVGRSVGRSGLVSDPPRTHDQIFVKLFKIVQWHCSQKGGGGNGARGRSPGVVGRAAVAGTEGPGRVPTEAVLDTLSSSDTIEKTVCCIEDYFGPQREHIVHALEKQVPDCFIRNKNFSYCKH